MEKNLQELCRHVNSLSEEFNKAFTELQACIKEARQAIEVGFCSEHAKFKEDLFSCGSLICEDCFVRSQQVSDKDRYN